MDKLIPSHAAALWVLRLIHRILDAIGLNHTPKIEEWAYIIMVMAVCLAFGWIIKKIIIFIVRKFVSMRHSPIGEALLKQRIITRCAHFIPPVIFLALSPLAFSHSNHIVSIIERLVAAYSVIAFGIGLAAVAGFIFYIYDQRENTRGLPTKGILNISRGIIWIVVIIIAVSIIVDKSPAYLLTGLGAFAAALMLIFKDSILGFVAGIQMAQNDMLHKGDWIVIPGTPANGTVMDVSLSAVKVQNFDNTIVTVPPYTLVSTSFQNYRGMKDAGARRFTRTLMVDTPTVTRLTPDILDRAVKAHPELQPFVDQYSKTPTPICADTGIRPVNGTVETNLGLFRAYCCMYLEKSPWVNSSMQFLVRILDPTITGIPLDIYAFAVTTDWNAYEAIQGAIMEHFAVAAADFGLGIYTAGAMTIEQANPVDIRTLPEAPKA